ncbi:MAG: hypothetical protein GXP38_03680, partial [Chloroflexi bacterium]|nr:hypothetical protein [Chloroflexota bacterium]
MDYCFTLHRTRHPYLRVGRGQLGFLLPLLAAWVWILSLSACAAPPPSPTPQPPSLRGAGSPVLAPLWPQLREGFEKSRGEPVLWEWTPLASGQALRELDQGLLDFALITDPTAEERYSHFSFTPLASDTLALIVSPTLDLDTLSTHQIQGILRGTAQNWQDFGLEMEPIRLVIRDQDSGAFALLTQVWMPDHPITLAARVLPNDADIVAYVASHPGSIGFASLSAVDERVKVVAI